MLFRSEAIDLYKQAIGFGTPFHVVLTDLDMPRKDGADVIRHIKTSSNPATVYLYTARDSSEAYTRAETKLNGCRPDAILIKPALASELLALFEGAKATSLTYNPSQMYAK